MRGLTAIERWARVFMYVYVCARVWFGPHLPSPHGLKPLPQFPHLA